MGYFSALAVEVTYGRINFHVPNIASNQRGYSAVKLVSVEVDHFKNILKSGVVVIQPDVTCVVGKNESGKTAFLQALHRFNPAQPNVMFNAQRHILLGLRSSIGGKKI